MYLTIGIVKQVYYISLISKIKNDVIVITNIVGKKNKFNVSSYLFLDFSFISQKIICKHVSDCIAGSVLCIYCII